MSGLLGLDVGERRIGVAWGDPATGVVRPLRTVGRGRTEDDVRTIGRVAAESGAEAIVVGLPLDARGGEGSQAAAIRAWADAVLPQIGLPVRWRDERHTSMRAEARLGGLPRGRSGGPPSPAARRAWRARVDREAAAEILRAELDATDARDPEDREDRG